MAKKDLNSLIADLKEVREFSKNENISKLYDKLFSVIIYNIGKRTAYDTGVAREQIKGILRELGDSELASQLDTQIYEFWHTLEERQEEGATYEFTKQGNYYKVKVLDYGFSNQAELGIVSDIHPRKDPMVVPRQIDFVVDEFEASINNEIETIINQIQDSIIRKIEKGRW